MGLTADQITEYLVKILASSTFQNASHSRAMLNYLVRECVQGRADRLKEYTIGVEALGRGESFDPRIDPIVRAEASRLRTRLDRYYAAEGQADALQIALPKGSYALQFLPRTAAGKPETGDTVGAGRPSGRLGGIIRPSVWNRRRGERCAPARTAEPGIDSEERTRPPAHARRSARLIGGRRAR